MAKGHAGQTCPSAGLGYIIWHRSAEVIPRSGQVGAGMGKRQYLPVGDRSDSFGDRSDSFGDRSDSFGEHPSPQATQRRGSLELESWVLGDLGTGLAGTPQGVPRPAGALGRMYSCPQAPEEWPGLGDLVPGQECAAGTSSKEVIQVRHVPLPEPVILFGIGQRRSRRGRDTKGSSRCVPE